MFTITFRAHVGCDRIPRTGLRRINKGAGFIDEDVHELCPLTLHITGWQWSSTGVSSRIIAFDQSGFPNSLLKFSNKRRRLVISFLSQPDFKLWRNRNAAIRYSTAPMPAIFNAAGQSSAKPTPLRKMPMAISM